VYDLNVLRVTPAQSKSAADVAEVIGKLAGDRMFKPVAGTACKFVQRRESERAGTGR